MNQRGGSRGLFAEALDTENLPFTKLTPERADTYLVAPGDRSLHTGVSAATHRHGER